MRKQKRLRELIYSNKLEFIMESHSAICAKIVENVGFEGIWASGLSISASLGYRDNNEMSWTQMTDVCKLMNRNIDIPILVDGDTGYGNFNNFRLLVQELEDSNIGGVCIEDKIFPKSNSFLDGEKQKLCNIDEFCGKIKAGKDVQKEDDFVIVARLESFIVGNQVEDALERATKYCESGADAILVHSKRTNEKDIEQFMKYWNNRKPVIIVPTTYYNVDVKKFEEMGVSLVIWANHNIRASISAIEKTSLEIFKSQSIKKIENEVASINKIFELQNVEEYKNAEENYLNYNIM